METTPLIDERGDRVAEMATARGNNDVYRKKFREQKRQLCYTVFMHCVVIAITSVLAGLAFWKGVLPLAIVLVIMTVISTIVFVKIDMGIYKGIRTAELRNRIVYHPVQYSAY